MLIRWLIWFLLLYIGYRVIKAIVAPSRKGQSPPDPKGEETVQDPVCGMFLAPKDAVVGVLEGKRHYFCSMNCLEKFREQLDHHN